MYFAKKIKLILRFCFSCLIGLVKLDFQKNQLLVFNYHNFNNSKNIYDEMYVSYKNFEKQIVFFKNKNLLISYNELLIMRLNDSKKKKILITIDDADFSVKKTIPIILMGHVKGTFLTSGCAFFLYTFVCVIPSTKAINNSPINIYVVISIFI